MPDDMSNRATGNTVRCDDCGTVFPDFDWTPGMLCPKCASAQFGPVVVIGDNAEYYKADRSGGFALEDVRFGRLAQWAEIITPKQFQKALHDQKQLAAAGKNVPDIGALLVRQKLMNRRQVRAILEARCAVPGSMDDMEFRLAVQRLGYVTEVQVGACQKLQKRAAAEGADPLPLPLMLHEKRLMQENQIVALLKSALAQGKGLLSRIERASGKERRMANKARGGVLTRKAQLIRIGLAIALPIIMVFVWHHTLGGGVELARVRCLKAEGGCGAEGGAPANSNWPVKCPECEKEAVYPLAICLECGETFPVTNFSDYGEPTTCPKCGATKHKIITEDLDVDALRDETAEREEPASGE